MDDATIVLEVLSLHQRPPSTCISWLRVVVEALDGWGWSARHCWYLDSGVGFGIVYHFLVLNPQYIIPYLNAGGSMEMEVGIMCVDNYKRSNTTFISESPPCDLSLREYFLPQLNIVGYDGMLAEWNLQKREVKVKPTSGKNGLTKPQSRMGYRTTLKKVHNELAMYLGQHSHQTSHHRKEMKGRTEGGV